MPVNYPRKLSIKWLREHYLNKQIKPEEVIREIILRSEKDRDLNIWITPPAMDVITPYLDRLEKLDPASSPLWGIPFAIKDNIDLAGVMTTAGCPEYAYIPKNSATIVERLIEAGAIPLGKTNLDQFATGLVGTRSPYGETHNALREELISGGSSSGSAVAVARGHAVFSLGTDTAGSGRVPAALNQLVGYKPSLGAWPKTGVVPACASLDCVTAFTHSLEDAYLVDQIVRGMDDSDPWSKNLPFPIPKRPKKFFLPKEPLDFFGPLAKEYSYAWEQTVKRLDGLNVPIEYVDTGVFSQAAAVLYEGPWVAERWADLGDFITSYSEKALPVTERVLRTGASDKYSAAAVFKAQHKLQSLKLEARKLLSDGVLIMPTSGGTWTRDQVREDPIGTNRDMGRYTNHCNLLNLCAIAVPSDEAAPKTPFGITLFGLAENEHLLYGAADLFLNHSLGSGKLRDLPAHLDTTFIAVCGLHMRGLPLEKQMLDFGARFIREASTATKYQLIKLPTLPPKPGLIKKQAGGSSIDLEIWEMPIEKFGSFTASIPSPLGIGKIELDDGSEVPGFICEAYAN